MRILLLGKHGQLGWELHRTLLPLGQVVALDYPEIDFAKPDLLRQMVRETRPGLIVNASAYTAVDKAEAEPELARQVNAIAPGILAEQAKEINAVLIHFSTDYVFDGANREPYTEADTPNPINVYGESKRSGEMAVEDSGCIYLILRTSWVYSLRRDSFVTKVLQWARQQKQLRVVDDQVSSPTWARMLAEVTAQTLAMGRGDLSLWVGEHCGLYHLAGSGAASRLEWAQAILRLDPRSGEQVTQEILPARTAEFPTPAQRPLYSVLNCKKFANTFGLGLPTWKDVLRLAMETDHE